ncbi:MAG: hypothetical protein SFU27_06510 [Thermonemataceae bacterium]|nr:hypothetical protein [Thermonemataceae bacterium]
MQKRTIEQIKAVMQKKEYVFFEKGDYNLNLIAVRENDSFENTFSDTLYVIYKVKGIWQMLVLPWTTLAGTKGIGGEQKPLTGAQTGTGVDGVAVIVEGQYRSVFNFVDTYTGFSKYPFFNQVQPMNYYRDNDRDGKITRTGKVYRGNYATLLHRMSNNGVASNEVNTEWASWSQGCNGCPEPEFARLVELTRKAVKLHGTLFTYTLLHANSFHFV